MVLNTFCYTLIENVKQEGQKVPTAGCAFSNKIPLYTKYTGFLFSKIFLKTHTLHCAQTFDR